MRGDVESLDLRQDERGVRLSVRARPGASRDGIAGIHGAALKIAVRTPPERGRANKAIIALLSRVLGLRKKHIERISGTASPDKVFRVLDETPESLRQKIRAAISAR